MESTDRPAPAERTLRPTDHLPEDRPRADSQPCAACGSLLDPLRSKVVLAYEDGYRYLCDADCAHAYRRGSRHRMVRTPQTRPGPPAMDTGARARMLALMPPTRARTPEDRRGIWLGLGAGGLAALLGLFGAVPAAAVASAVLSCVAAGGALWASAGSIRHVGVLGWAVGPGGVVLAAAAAHDLAASGGRAWPALVGAAFAGLAMVARAWLDTDGKKPIDQAVDELTRHLPLKVRAPVTQAADPMAMSMELVPVESVRTGEEVIALAGETLAIDGVIQAGEARVLPYPGATTSVRRSVGEPLLAGATVIDGGLRVLATRVGDERALVRVARFGSAVGRDPAPLVHTADLITRWGGGAALALCALVAAIAKTGGMASPLSAAAAVLLAAPLLAARRSVERPLMAAAAAAGSRGIVYDSAGALEATGRVSVVAMSPYGTLTEGKPEIVELHLLSEGSSDELIAMAAAAERAAGGHALARAIERFARSRRVRPIEVRRATHRPGRGVTAIGPDGQSIVIGSRRLLLDEGISVGAADAEAARAEAAGRTPLFFGIDGRVRAVMTAQDELTVGARPAIQRMFDLNLEVVLLTGDQRGAVKALATALDIAHVKAELLPEERGEEVRSLREAGGVVAAIGQPDADDAALSAADVGIVLGGAGGMTEKEVALVGDDVRDAAAALWLGHAARGGAVRALRVAVIAFALVAASAASGLIVPAFAALVALGVDAYGLRAGARLAHRIELRLPARS